MDRSSELPIYLQELQDGGFLPKDSKLVAYGGFPCVQIPRGNRIEIGYVHGGDIITISELPFNASNIPNRLLPR